MPAKYPRQITVGGRTIAVRVDHEQDSWGEYHADARLITLAPKTLHKASTLRETLRHEMVHAALDISGLSYSQAPFDKMEEALVRCLDSLYDEDWERVRKQLTP